jgi:hypothetical protein
MFEGGMTIDTSGQWWKGENFNDIIEFMKALTQEGYPAEEVKPSICECGHRYFRLEADSQEGCARRICTSCKKSSFIGDSHRYWEDASPEQIRCPCGNDSFEIGIAFAFRESGDVRWIYVGQRCEKCGILGSYVDWKIDDSPTDELLTKT